MARLATSVAALGLLGTACVAQNDQPPGRQSEAKYGNGATSDDAPGVDLGPRGGEGSTVEIPGRSSGGSTAASGSQGVDDNGPLGINARLYLSADVPKLVVEIDAVRGFMPSQSALDMLRARLDEVSDKPGGIEMLPVESFSGGRDRWTISDLEAAERRNRDRYSSRDAIVLYLLYVDGSYEEEDALGVAFESSAFAVFIEQLREAAATPLVPAASIERTVVVHEMGHVLALVNIGYTSPRNHEDPQHDNHSSNPDSVMYWSMDNVGIASLLGGRTAPPTDFDAEDRADLADLKSGRLRVE